MGCSLSTPGRQVQKGPKSKQREKFLEDSANFDEQAGKNATQPGPNWYRSSATPPLGEATLGTSLVPEEDNPLAGNTSYEKVEYLCAGSAGFVILAKHVPTSSPVAIKLLERGSQPAAIADREVFNMMACSLHPHIIKFREVFLTARHLAIVSEYAEGGDLTEYIARRAVQGRAYRALPEAQARTLFQQVVSAVDFCHARGISNRDLKAENVLLCGGWGDIPLGSGVMPPVIAKLCDFGFSKDERFDSVCKTKCGTPEYIAPEVLVHGAYDGKKSDIWSAGVMLYVMLTGRYPFRLRCDERLNPVVALQQMFPRIAAAQFEVPGWVSPGCTDLLRAMMCADPDKRITVNGIFQHPWFCKGLPGNLVELRSTLGQIPDQLHLSFLGQSHDEVLEILQQATQVEEARPWPPPQPPPNVKR